MKLQCGLVDIEASVDDGRVVLTHTCTCELGDKPAQATVRVWSKVPKHGSGSDYGLSGKPPDQFRVEHVLRVLLARCHARAKFFRSSERTIRTYKFRPQVHDETGVSSRERRSPGVIRGFVGRQMDAALRGAQPFARRTGCLGSDGFRAMDFDEDVFFMHLQHSQRIAAMNIQIAKLSGRNALGDGHGCNIAEVAASSTQICRRSMPSSRAAMIALGARGRRFFWKINVKHFSNSGCENPCFDGWVRLLSFHGQRWHPGRGAACENEFPGVSPALNPRLPAFIPLGWSNNGKPDGGRAPIGGRAPGLPRAVFTADTLYATTRRVHCLRPSCVRKEVTKLVRLLGNARHAEISWSRVGRASPGLPGVSAR